MFVAVKYMLSMSVQKSQSRYSKMCALEVLQFL